MPQMPMQMGMPQYMQGMHMPPFTAPGGMQMPAGACHGGLTSGPQDGITLTQPSGGLAAHSLHAPPGKHDHGFVDDKKQISTAYKSLGMLWKWGSTRVATKKFRSSLCYVCDNRKYPLIKVSQMEEEMVDMLIFSLAGVLPSARPIDMCTSTKGEFRTQVRDMYQVKLEMNASRLSMLSDEFDNLPLVALRLGYPIDCCSPGLRARLDAMRVPAMMPGPVSGADGEVQKPRGPRIIALENGVDDDEDEPRAKKARTRDAVGPSNARMLHDSVEPSVTLALPPMKFGSKLCQRNPTEKKVPNGTDAEVKITLVTKPTSPLLAIAPEEQPKHPTEGTSQGSGSLKTKAEEMQYIRSQMQAMVALQDQNWKRMMREAHVLTRAFFLLLEWPHVFEMVR